MPRRLTILLPLILSLFILGACETLEGLSEDFSNFTTLNQTERVDAKIEKSCPQVKVVDELASLSQFSDLSDQSDYNLISKVRIKEIETACMYQGDNVSVDLKLAFQSMLGVRGREENAAAPPSFSYPFFVAVTDPKGTILAKEVFAATMTYQPGSQSHIHNDNLRQIIPVVQDTDGSQYEILIGFQLTDNQLAYNRRAMPPVQTQNRRNDALTGTSYNPVNITPMP